MPTLYCDFENGNDNYAGTSFAVLASGTNGRISSTTFSSTGASFPNDGSLIGQYLSIFNGTSYLTYNITAWVSSTSLTIAAISGGDALANQTVDRQYYIGGRWKSLTTGAIAARIAPGDTVRIMGSPAPTSLGQNGVWTSQALQATKNISSSTNATPIAITCTTHGYSTGDTVVITGHSTNTNANGTWEITVTGANTFTLDGSVGNGVGGASGTVRLRNNTRVMLTTAVTQNIASTGPGRAAWVASANCNYISNATFFKEHTSSDAITMAIAFTTGKAAYYTLPSALDLSGYQQVSFWLYAAGDEILAGEAELRLCSNTTGDTVVDTVPIPYTPAGRHRAVTWDKGSALGSSIASVALYINTDLSTTAGVSMMFSNIIACKASSDADSLTLTSLIGKNTTGETFWGIQSINGRRVMLDADTNATPTSTSVRGYYGTSETVTTWKRETIKLGPAASSTTLLQTIQDSGTDGAPITFSGGWDRTNMSTQNLETWLDGVNGNGYLLPSASWGVFEKLAGVRATSVIRFVGTGNIASLVAANNCSGSSSTIPVIFFATSTVSQHRFNRLNIDFIAANVCTSNGAIVGLQGPESRIKINKGMISNFDTCVRVDPSAYGTFYIEGESGAVIGNNGSRTMDFWNGVTYIKDLKFIDNPSSLGLMGGLAYSNNCDYADATEVGTHNFGSVLYSQKHDQTAGNHKIVVDGGLISSATDQRKTASGISWKMQPTTTTRSANIPLTLSLAKVACAANSLVTVKAWMHRDNSGLTIRLVCKGGQIAGVANDVTASVTTTNAWEEETITFTPTETGVVEITAEAWGGTTFSGWVDDLTISQA